MIMIATRLTHNKLKLLESMNARNGHSPEQHAILEAELDSTVLEEQLYSPNILRLWQSGAL